MKLFTIAIVLSAAAAEAQTAIQRLDGSEVRTIDAEIFARKTLSDAHVSGAELAVVQNGKLVWSFAYGLRHKSPDLPMTPDTNTWAASITKAVFSTYVMQLVERGEFDLDKPIAEQLSQPLDTYEPYKETASELVKDPRWQSVTPRMCLSHTSGLPNLSRFEPDKKLHLAFSPGTAFRYSGEGMNLVQFVVEQRKHKPLEELMQEAIFGPLGMTQTGMIYRHSFDANVSDRFNADGSFHAQTRRFPARAGGNMATCANDLGRFLSALLQGRVLKPQTLRDMLKPQLEIRTQHQFPFVDDHSPSPEATGVRLSYGLGWGLLTRTKFGPAFFKEGHGDGAQNYLICFTRSRSCMVLLTNDDNGEMAFRPLLEKILGDTVTPWEWECYTASCIETARKFQ